MLYKYLIFVVVMTSTAVLVSPTAAQVGGNSPLWTMERQDAPHISAIVQVSDDDKVGTGIIIKVDRSKPSSDGFLGHCLTAHHVVEGDDGRGQIRVKYRNGRRSKKCRVVQYNKQFDIALVWVWVPDNVKPAVMADLPAKWQDQLEFSGLGGGSELKCCLRRFYANASQPTNPEEIFADVSLLPGDSGGPVFNSKREVVGIISG